MALFERMSERKFKRTSEPKLKAAITIPESKIKLLENKESALFK